MSSSLAFGSLPSLYHHAFPEAWQLPTPKLCPHGALTPQPPCLPEPDQPCSTFCLSGFDCSAMSGISMYPLVMSVCSLETHFMLEQVSDFLPLEAEITFQCLSNACQLWCWRRLLRDPWTARRSNQSILKEINPEYSLEGLMLKLQYFQHLMQRANTLEKILMLGKIEGRRRRG